MRETRKSGSGRAEGAVSYGAPRLLGFSFEDDNYDLPRQAMREATEGGTRTCPEGICVCGSWFGKRFTSPIKLALVSARATERG